MNNKNIFGILTLCTASTAITLSLASCGIQDAPTEYSADTTAPVTTNADTKITTTKLDTSTTTLSTTKTVTSIKKITTATTKSTKTSSKTTKIPVVTLDSPADDIAAISDTDNVDNTEYINSDTEGYVIYDESAYVADDIYKTDMYESSYEYGNPVTEQVTDTITDTTAQYTECTSTLDTAEIYTEPIITTYTPVITTTTTTSGTVSSLPITDTEYILLCNVVGHEYGSDWVPVYEKAKIVAGVMNRVNDSRFPDTIDAVLHQPGQFYDVPYYKTYQVTESVEEAVKYYFNNTWEFSTTIKYWTGDGTWNYFRDEY